MPERTTQDRSHALMMSPPAGSFIPESRQKGSQDIRCAEIKTIPSMKKNSEQQERGPRTFKIGEYNRATASFEIPSGTNTPIAELNLTMQPAKPEFDLTDDCASDHYFQSSFARSLASTENKSLEYGVNKCSVDESGPLSLNVVPGSGKQSNPMEQVANSGTPNGHRCWRMPGQENWDLRRAEAAEITDEEMVGFSLNGPSVKKAGSYLGERPGSRTSSAFMRPPSDCRDRLGSPQSTSCRSSQHHRSYSSASDMTSVMLQSQVTTLQWQLRQAEASRQMHRAVLEQVVGFLQRTHNDLSLLQSSMMSDSVSTLGRVPRSRSVHNVESDVLNGSCTMSTSDSPTSFHKARSVNQITDPINCPKHGDAAFRDLTWRRPRRQQQEVEVSSPAKLSEEAFRLLRTVQSLLNTREPDLTSRLHSGGSSPVPVTADVSSASSTLDSDTPSSDTNFQSQDTVVHVGIKDHDELQAAFGGNCSPIPGLPAAHLKDATMSLGRRRRRRTVNGSPPQLSTSSADDESGFSSLNSFQEGTSVTTRGNSCQEVGQKHMREHCAVIHEEKRGSYQEVGLPLKGDENCKIHRRWSSTPADKLRSGSLGNVIRVLWV